MTDLPANEGLFDAALVTPEKTPRARRSRAKGPKAPVFKHATGAGMRVGGDNPVFHVISIIGTVVVALASFTQSVFAQLAVAVWQRTPSEVHFLTAVMVDAPIVVFSAATIAFRAREQRALTTVARLLAIFMTGLSSSNNFLHTVNVAGLDDYTDWVGACLNALSPVLVYACAEILGGLVVRPKIKHTALVKARALAAARLNEIKALKKAAKNTSAPEVHA